MVLDALRGYVQLASGLTEVTRQRAQAAAKALLQQTGADTLTTGLTSKVSELTDEIVATSKSNRQLLQAIVSNEVEGAVARLGFVRAEEVAGLTRRVQRLEQELAEERAAASAADVAAHAPKPQAKNAAAKKAAKKAAAKKAAAKKMAKKA
ncbi:polyhydroxyalkanoate synthesis protein PhaF [Kribbella pittospori]|uniref:Polyhydroxyalkanoate synthesis protein PhaF n=1 Tax=Kribbella pittospori TaxID=722689 RepID=A0A4R0KT76_9ACTN|nr:polyhydroxyalkanoate synthesis protein PhaF [Kribbella pittospori]TCC62346.1 polyhydroxyalkanoate synthesis protein PhaF [Kribbella pittospori]